MSSSSIGDTDYYQQQPSQTAITAFLAKLWALVNDSSCDDLIAWDSAGGSFHVYDQARFAREVLPRYFKHNNFASFIRQLNMYGFRKISTIEHGSLKNERDDIEFAHPNFIRGHDTLLESIKRRAPDHQSKMPMQQSTTKPEVVLSPPTTSPSSTVLVSNTYADTKPPRSVELTHLLDDVRNLQSKQTSLTDKLFHMQDENQALWREMSILKQKHAKQQQIVSKLMEFLLHFLTNPNQTHRPSVEQSSANQSQQSQAQHHPIPTQQLPSNSLKRKPAAIMLGEEPKKRTTMQQQQQQHLLSQQRGITINELTDNDSGGWLHTTDASPLVDLVPSPPPPPPLGVSITTQHPEDTYHPHTNNYEWTVPTDELRSSINFAKSTDNGNHPSNAYLSDFFLNPDPTSKTTLDEANLAGINTSLRDAIPLLKEEQLDFPHTFHSQEPNNMYPMKTNPSDLTLFSLDDITGDVHHIQSSLDNIRELMFDSLPESATIEDLFCDNHALLSPLLTSNCPTTNILAEQSKSDNQSSYSNTNSSTVPCKQLMLHKSEMPWKTSPLDADNQLLEQLINETGRANEQR